MKTRRGIYYNLKESEYIYDREHYRFYFSSEYNKYRFETQLEDYIKSKNEKIINNLELNIDITLIYMIEFYKKIEKRGFKIEVYKDGNFRDLKDFKIYLNI